MIVENFTNLFRYNDNKIIQIIDITGLASYDKVYLKINGIPIPDNAIIRGSILKGSIEITTTSDIPKVLRYKEHDIIINMSVIPILIKGGIEISIPTTIQISDCLSIPGQNKEDSYRYNYVIFNYDSNKCYGIQTPKNITSYMFYETCFIGFTDSNLLVLCGDVTDNSKIDQIIKDNNITHCKIFGYTKILNHLRSNSYITCINYG